MKLIKKLFMIMTVLIVTLFVAGCNVADETNEQTTKPTVETTEPIETDLDPSLSAYYSSALGLTGTQLKSALHEIIDDHHQLTYDEVKYALRDTDEDPDNPDNVILLYTGRSQAKTTFGGNANDWNREHVWAKSHGDFGNLNGPGTDLHHLRPTDASVNSSRGNKDFDYGGTPHAECIILVCKTDSNSWEPDDSVKGDIARMMFYMAVRYEAGDMVDLELNESDSNSNSKAPFIGKLSVLLEWHLLDPVSDFEINRNNEIEAYQNNRNPFIDNPAWAEMIFGN